MNSTTDEELLAQVRELRQRGSGPKQIAKALALRPAQATALIRRAAEAEQTALALDERPIVGCWINQGWSSGLDLSAAPDWAAADPVAARKPSTQGWAQILVARRERASRVTMVGLLVDVYCLGVKAVAGPEPLSEGRLDTYRRNYFDAFDHPPLRIDIAQAQHIVHGAVAYARTLGFEPAPEFTDAAPHLGTPPAGLPDIGYGQDGKPFYLSGPHDDARAVVRTLEKTCGAGNYHYVVAQH